MIVMGPKLECGAGRAWSVLVYVLSDRVHLPAFQLRQYIALDSPRTFCPLPQHNINAVTSSGTRRLVQLKQQG